MKSPQYSEIRCSSTPSLYRYEELEGRKHLVIPVVMLIGNTIIQAANAPTAELVSQSCLERSFIKSFDGRPVVPYHPKKKGKFVSANDPDIFTSSRIGTIFFTLLNGNNLGCEGWIDIDRANNLGGDAKLAVERIEAGETIDISVGVYHDADIVEGELNGQKYGAIWTEILGDHLALLPSGEGACNQELGCGAPRMAESIPAQETIMENKSTSPISFLSRLLSKLRPSMIFDDGDSDGDLRKMLTKEMRKIDPSFDWVLDGCIYRDVNSFIYMTYVLMGGSYTSEVKYWRRTFTLSDDGKSVKINDDAVEVKLKEVWETVDEGGEGKEMSATQLAVNCSCQSGQNGQSDQSNNNQPNHEETVMANANESVPVVVSETESTAASPVAAPVASPAANPTSTSTPAGASAPVASTLTIQEAIAACPDLRPLVAAAERFNALEAARKADLVTRLSTAQTVYDLASLQSKPIDELEKIASLLSLDTPKVDYSPRGLTQEPRAANSAPAVKELPDPWGLSAKGIQLN